MSATPRPRPAPAVHRHAEAPTTLTRGRHRAPSGLLDQFGFWGNLGVSLLGFAGRSRCSPRPAPARSSFGAAVTAAVVGSVLGGLILGASLVLGARTGAPAMVLLRGLLGARASFLPTVLNIAQCLGWAVFELVAISTGLQALTARRRCRAGCACCPPAWSPRR